MTVFGRPHLHLRRTDSTNDRARELAEAGAPSGTIVTADEQSAGRGRRGRVWSAPAGTGAALLGDPAAARARARAAAARRADRGLRGDRGAGAGRGAGQVAQRRLDRRGEGRRGPDRGPAAGLGGDRGRASTSRSSRTSSPTTCAGRRRRSATASTSRPCARRSAAALGALGRAPGGRDPGRVPQPRRARRSRG